MTVRFLLDTQIVVRWLAQPNRLSREQMRVLTQAAQNEEPLAVSTISLLEIAVLADAVNRRVPVRQLLLDLEDPRFRFLPITLQIADEIAAIGDNLRDPADRAIVSTARVHGLRLVTSDQRIVDSGLARVIE